MLSEAEVPKCADANDPLIRQLREELSDNDVRIVEALNARLKLVARLKRVKSRWISEPRKKHLNERADVAGGRDHTGDPTRA